MRLWIAFVVLLTLATLGTGLLMQNFTSARGGDPGARLVVFAAAPVSWLSFLLLARIVLRVDAARRAGRGQ